MRSGNIVIEETSSFLAIVLFMYLPDKTGFSDNGSHLPLPLTSLYSVRLKGCTLNPALKRIERGTYMFVFIFATGGEQGVDPNHTTAKSLKYSSY